jgi:tetratricopeptide (TPR) repeat protein
VSTGSWDAARLDELEPVGGWFPLRQRFDIGAFGINAWTDEVGSDVIGEHDEADSGHEELYVVVRGRATFTVGGDEIDAPAGTIVFVSDPSLRRKGVVAEPDTLVLSVGAVPGQAYEPLGWEANAAVIPLFGTGEYVEAKRRLLEALEAWPEGAGLLYNLACAESRLGETDAALEHLGTAIELSPRFAEFAQADEDLEPIRSDPRFPVAT